ncbi:MAG: hypothetical protein VXV78_05705 [Pseudomonadota bacterium]|uniref:hypothetical protein n=1 Tax=Halomonadaceae TaxID=28256 RepID=UPI00209E5926|nr:MULTISPECIES: hypothetical protein [unclassified Halomonas]MCP1304278.1 hypothetical protein [Halomonas sp. R1t8]MCP1330409.1 hypothetical protein [Halomonas sp. R1t4]MEC7295681.1 hypothetical protein [Pseudomonadota bacterium]
MQLPFTLRLPCYQWGRLKPASIVIRAQVAHGLAIRVLATLDLITLVRTIRAPVTPGLIIPERAILISIIHAMAMAILSVTILGPSAHVGSVTASLKFA